jgi:hypothetical protein
MSHENSARAIQSELASEYGKYVKAKSNKGIANFIVKVFVIPGVALLIVLTGASFAVANFSPATYTQVKDIIFAKVDVEKLTGQPNAINKELLDSWLVLSAAEQQGQPKAQEELVQEQQTSTPLN